MPCLHSWRRRVCGKELDVDRVVLIYLPSAVLHIYILSERKSGDLTDRNHALAVVIQILQYLLNQCIHALPLHFATQEVVLLLQRFEKFRQLSHHTLIRAEFRAFIEDYRKVEDEFVAVVAVVLETYGVAEQAVFVVADGDEAVAEFLLGDYVLGDGVEVDQRGWVVWRRGRGDGAIGDLVDYF